MRGSNQSTQTKHATSIICDALCLLDCGQVAAAKYKITEALMLLPEVNREIQDNIGIGYLGAKNGTR